MNILLNIFVGPVLNAARGVATSVNHAVGGFASNFMTALNPQITKSYAIGDLKYCHSLVERGSRFSFFILLLIAMPIFLETEFVLTLWLKQYPEHTINFVRLVLVLSMIDVLSQTLINLQTATGKIRNYQLAVGGVLLLNFPLSYLCLSLGFAPESTLMVAIIIAILCMILRLLFLRKMAQLSMRSFLKNVCVKVLVVALIASILPMILRYNLSYGWERLLIVSGASVLSGMLAIYYIGCSKGERQFIASKIVALKQKIFV